MSRQEDRARKIVQWLEHLQGWKDSGQSVCAYAKVHGLSSWAMYYWRSVLIREGRWHEASRVASRRAAVGARALTPVQFAQVTVMDSPRRAPLMLRLALANGRRAEIELTDPEQLGEVLGVLERRA
jgi:hypothetical protein